MISTFNFKFIESKVLWVFDMRYYNIVMSKILLIYKKDKLTLRLPSRLFIAPNERKRIVRLIMKDLEIKGMIDAESSKKIIKCPVTITGS